MCLWNTVLWKCTWYQQSFYDREKATDFFLQWDNIVMSSKELSIFCYYQMEVGSNTSQTCGVVVPIEAKQLSVSL